MASLGQQVVVPVFTSLALEAPLASLQISRFCRGR